MQLIEPGVAMYDPASGEAGAKGAREERRIGEAEVLEYFGAGPDKVIDIQALAGDSTDNVPGAPGIGVKTAAQLIGEFGDLDTLLARANEIKQPKRREALTLPENVERIRISKALVTLVRDAPLETPLEALATPKLEGKELIAFFKAMELNTITRRVAEICGIDASSIEPDPRFVGPAGWQGRNGEAALAKAQEEAQPQIAPAAAPAAANVTTPADLVAARASEAKSPDRPRALQDGADGRRAQRLHRPCARGWPCRFRRPAVLARPASGGSRRRLARGGAGTGLLRPHRTPPHRGRSLQRGRPRAGPDPRGGRARALEAADGGAGRSQDRPRRQVWHAGVRASRRRRGADRRYDADILCARRGTGRRPRVGRTVGAVPRPQADPAQRSHRIRTQPRRLCPCDDRQGG